MTVCTSLKDEGESHPVWILGARTTRVVDVYTADGERYDDLLETTTTTIIDYNLLLGTIGIACAARDRARVIKNGRGLW